jgi:hypothetical protein
VQAIADVLGTTIDAYCDSHILTVDIVRFCLLLIHERRLSNSRTLHLLRLLDSRRRGRTLLALDMAREGTLGREQVIAAGAARRDPPAAPPPVPAQRVRRGPLGAATPVAGVEKVEVRVHDVVREVLDVRRVALRTTAAARAPKGAAAVKPGALAHGRAGGGASRDPVAEGEVMGDVALDAPGRERDDAGAATPREQAQDVDRRRRISRRVCDYVVLDERRMTECGISDEV